MATMRSHSTSESSDFCWRSSTRDAVSSENLNEGARPVLSKQLVLTSDNIQNFIPEYIREKFQEPIEPNLCTIKAVCIAEQKEPFYTFVLNWYKNLAHVDTDSSALTSKAKKSPIRAPLTVEQTRRCDGPCGKMRPVKELRVHGRCEHAICRFCTTNAPMVGNIDGSTGCCNEECFVTDLANICPDPLLRHEYFQKIINKHKIIADHESRGHSIKRPQQTMGLSSASQTSSVNKMSRAKGGLQELMYVKVLILKKGPMETICRRHTVAEIASTESLRSTLQWILGYGQSLHKSRIFFNNSGNADDSKLQEIDLKGCGDMKISNFPSTNGMLNFVVDYTNVVGGNFSSPYL
uniref:Ubiquitin-like domain-containing protein n=1 Tax=Elaeophora elaphi TaxID=1147741 RepID=A0A0R3RS39_9BILA